MNLVLALVIPGTDMGGQVALAALGSTSPWTTLVVTRLSTANKGIASAPLGLSAPAFLLAVSSSRTNRITRFVLMAQLAVGGEAALRSAHRWRQRPERLHQHDAVPRQRHFLCKPYAGCVWESMALEIGRLASACFRSASQIVLSSGSLIVLRSLRCSVELAWEDTLRWRRSVRPAHGRLLSSSSHDDVEWSRKRRLRTKYASGANLVKVGCLLISRTSERPCRGPSELAAYCCMRKRTCTQTCWQEATQLGPNSNASHGYRMQNRNACRYVLYILSIYIYIYINKYIYNMKPARGPQNKVF